MRTFGTARLKGGQWEIDAEPHVVMRIKRHFVRSKLQKGRIVIRATDEVSRDLEWFCLRFPLVIEQYDRQALDRQARAYDERVELALQIMQGTYKVPPFQMHLPPRDYQSQAAALAFTNGALLLADEVGLGKTCSALALVAMARALPALVVCPVHIQLQWQREIWRFLRLEGHIAQRSTPYAPKGRQPDFLIMSYAKLSGWQSELRGKYPTVIFDEVHELRRRDSDKYSAAQLVAHSATYRIGCSGTPIFNYGGEFWSVMNVLCPDSLGSWGEFCTEWCNGIQDQQGKQRISQPRAFGSYLRETGLMLRRTRKDVGRELPALSRIPHEIDCDLAALRNIQTSAVELARIILAQSGAASGLEKMQAAGEFDMRMRQATGIAKAPYVAEFVRMLLEADPDDSVVLFGWHRAVYDLWADLLKAYEPVFYTGSESPQQKDAAVTKFLRKQSRLMIMSLRSGSGVDGLQKVCSKVVIGELDWSPGALEQCVGRVHRDGQGDPVFAYYLVTHQGSDPVMEDVLGIKSGQIEGVRDPDADVAVLREVDPEHVKKLAQAYLESIR